jgi:Xaa-Pro aminopeptidase
MNKIHSRQIEKRLKKLWQLISTDADAILITSPENVRYLSGFAGTEGTLLLTRNMGFFLTDGRYATQAKELVEGYSIIIFKEKHNELGKLIKKLNIKSLGFESRNITVASILELEKQTGQVNLKPYAEELDSLRTVKDSDEVRLLEKAAMIASESLREVIPLIKPGIREIEIAAEIEYHMRQKGGNDIAFQTIVASGFRSALPHGVASAKEIKTGDIVIIDFGVVYMGYSSDETCTFMVGKPTKKQKRVFTTVKKAHDLAINAVKPGVALKHIDAVARSYIEKKGYGKFFNHGTGHGIGLCIHENPVVSFRSKQPIEKGMVFTIEPGVYIPEWGGVRIEDTLVVTSDGCEVITRSDKNFKSACLY